MLSRRGFLSLSGGLLGGLLLPRALRAETPERRFLFVFCRGGWDTTFCFTPMLHHPDVDREEGSELAVAGDVPFVSNETRPSVAAFFEEYGDRTCLINGFEVRSITHERCRQLVLTGGGTDDWAAHLAAASQRDLLLPHLVLRGPAYTHDHTPHVVRVGVNGQLPTLLDGTALSTSNAAVVAPDPALAALEEAFVTERAAERSDSFGAGYRDALDKAASLAAYADRLTLHSGTEGCRFDVAGDASTVFDAFELDLARCAMIEDKGWCNMSWDTHEGNWMQDWHYEGLFGGLRSLMADLDSRGSLADEVTVVVFSEMGRHPRTNTRGGKDHWTYTSMMLIGAGVRGGRSIGGLDDDGRGRRIDLASGEETDKGTALQASNVGATLLTLGGIDPEAIVPGFEPISAAIAG